ncbi:sialate O-acetylesterase [Algibacter mikhailovii]|uniref:Sialate O-acetylesterase domain-containing protein n=1 Tax=Algibacter mikhailovii TaxID=425498 RepID=A0A918R4Z6_9FLAO|nr:sialate O-acetylesterase [Algibacter mikhailovii]GGZ87484.1 hypothetical protein GCM10007028_27090 [Algibacter mikhailovii]
MMKQKLLILLLLFPLVAIGQRKEKDTIRLYYLGGQSNMDGYGYNKDLPNSLNKAFENVWIFHGNPVPDENSSGGQGTWETLKPGHGVGFSSYENKNKLSKRFGIELSFAQKLQEYYPNEKMAFIKYSRGGSSIDSLAAGKFGSWEPDFNGKTGVNQYDHFLKTIRNAHEYGDINGDGIEDYLLPMGIIWMQGESDGDKTEEIASRYYIQLRRLMDLIRASLLSDDLPVVIGKISDSHNIDTGIVWPFGDLVQYAQEKYAKTDKNAAIVRSTRNYKYSDRWHYDSNGYIDLGKEFALAVYQLNQN